MHSCQPGMASQRGPPPPRGRCPSGLVLPEVERIIGLAPRTLAEVSGLSGRLPERTEALPLFPARRPTAIELRSISVACDRCLLLCRCFWRVAMMSMTMLLVGCISRRYVNRTLMPACAARGRGERALSIRPRSWAQRPNPGPNPHPDSVRALRPRGCGRVMSSPRCGLAGAGPKALTQQDLGHQHRLVRDWKVLEHVGLLRSCRERELAFGVAGSGTRTPTGCGNCPRCLQGTPDIHVDGRSSIAHEPSLGNRQAQGESKARAATELLGPFPSPEPAPNPIASDRLSRTITPLRTEALAPTTAMLAWEADVPKDADDGVEDGADDPDGGGDHGEEPLQLGRVVTVGLTQRLGVQGDRGVRCRPWAPLLVAPLLLRLLGGLPKEEGLWGHLVKDGDRLEVALEGKVEDRESRQPAIATDHEVRLPAKRKDVRPVDGGGGPPAATNRSPTLRELRSMGLPCSAHQGSRRCRPPQGAPLPPGPARLTLELPAPEVPFATAALSPSSMIAPTV